MQTASRRQQRSALTALFLITAGCNSSDERLADLSRQSLERQAEQNRLVEANNRQVVDAIQKLVEADAQARRDNSQLQQQIQADRAGVNQQRDALELERRDIADQRNRDPIIAESIRAAVGLLVAVLPLAVAVYLLRALFHRSDDEAMADLLVEEMLQQHPLVATAAKLGTQSNVTNRLPTARSQPSRIGLIPQRNHLTALDTKFKTRVIVHVEGAHDIEFLRRMSHVLNHDDKAIPDLGTLEAEGQLEFVTSACSSLLCAVQAKWASDGEFCLYDREISPTTEARIRLVSLLNRRPDCRAVLTSKRAIENYLHPEAIREVCGIEITFGDFDDVAEIVAKATFSSKDRSSWESLSRRARRRLRDKAKKWLNREAVDRMTPQRLSERDPAGEVIGWLRSIAVLAADPFEASA
jgi:hypothetical protein